jgi:hypothetical protein
VAAAISDEEMRAVREREGIPDLEEAEEEEDEGEKPAAAAAEKNPKSEDSLRAAKQEEAKDATEVARNNGAGGLEVSVVLPGRELLAALKEVEELFARAAEAGKDVSGMLEAAARAPDLKGPAFIPSPQLLSSLSLSLSRCNLPNLRHKCCRIPFCCSGKKCKIWA